MLRHGAVTLPCGGSGGQAVGGAGMGPENASCDAHLAAEDKISDELPFWPNNAILRSGYARRLIRTMPHDTNAAAAMRLGDNNSPKIKWPIRMAMTGDRKEKLATTAAG